MKKLFFLAVLSFISSSGVYAVLPSAAEEITGCKKEDLAKFGNKISPDFYNSLCMSYKSKEYIAYIYDPDDSEIHNKVAVEYKDLNATNWEPLGKQDFEKNHVGKKISFYIADDVPYVAYVYKKDTSATTFEHCLRIMKYKNKIWSAVKVDSKDLCGTGIDTAFSVYAEQGILYLAYSGDIELNVLKYDTNKTTNNKVEWKNINKETPASPGTTLNGITSLYIFRHTDGLMYVGYQANQTNYYGGKTATYIRKLDKGEKSWGDQTPVYKLIQGPSDPHLIQLYLWEQWKAAFTLYFKSKSILNPTK